MTKEAILFPEAAHGTGHTAASQDCGNAGREVVRDAARDDFVLEALPHFEDIRRRASLLLKDSAIAWDAAQETYLLAWKSFHRYEPGTNCRAWLFRILWFVVMTQRSRRSRWTGAVQREASTSELSPATQLVGEQSDENVTAALKSLNPIFQSALLLVYVEQFSYREASAILKVPIGTVMSRLSRGRAALRARLARSSSRRVTTGASQL
jgi:RNA polymerase sigma-70 factor (ECF subfamily)